MQCSECSTIQSQLPFPSLSRLISITHPHSRPHNRTRKLKQPDLGMKGFCDPMGQTRILWVHSTRVCLGPKTITHLLLLLQHLTIVALNYHFC